MKIKKINRIKKWIKENIFLEFTPEITEKERIDLITAACEAEELLGLDELEKFAEEENKKGPYRKIGDLRKAISKLPDEGEIALQVKGKIAGPRRFIIDLKGGNIIIIDE
jgi:hypothetical protein